MARAGCGCRSGNGSDGRVRPVANLDCARAVSGVSQSPDAGRSRNNWYLYCTGDPLNANDKDARGNLRNHYIATWHSVDLIHWTYNGDAFPADPAWVGVETNLWAPAVKHFNGRYYLYYVAPATSTGG